ncbi:Piso0_004387 [Millerozyma farinosa CBS 7064]|uniref:Piso0_004387 protein n=1 Tax=Pichia sorbitophila (strain ATCC MYA-4447 / BCRC 22081 / CBS 7064 / NBRC 10061 / NRRL Y-12695) TaxID=559304 RepID=G8Y5B9_PICSO|nr:Piso0_004387 [Millerozyma farinosa CBS 7064]CCE84830.1 Piso0_004387 [Millerozyma farinosa CBS 7064]
MRTKNQNITEPFVAMEVENIEKDIEEINGDISSIKKEIGELEIRYAKLSREKEQEVDGEGDDDDERADDDTDEKPNMTDSKTEAFQQIRHGIFDTSISKYFSESRLEKDLKVISGHKRQKTNDVDRAIDRIEQNIAINESVLLENVLRFNGVTAFPLNRLPFENSELIGIRFDMFSHNSQSFLKPHYAILKKVQVESKESDVQMRWSVYRHTLPAYIDVEYASRKLEAEDEEIALWEFATGIREGLLVVQYRHDKIDALLNLKFGHVDPSFPEKELKVIRTLEKDLSCQRVVISFSTRFHISSYKLDLELYCSDRAVESASFLHHDAKHNETILLCENLLNNCDMNALIRTFKKTLKHLLDKRIL